MVVIFGVTFTAVQLFVASEFNPFTPAHEVTFPCANAFDKTQLKVKLFRICCTFFFFPNAKTPDTKML